MTYDNDSKINCIVGPTGPRGRPGRDGLRGPRGFNGPEIAFKGRDLTFLSSVEDCTTILPEAITGQPLPLFFTEIYDVQNGAPANNFNGVFFEVPVQGIYHFDASTRIFIPERLLPPTPETFSQPIALFITALAPDFSEILDITIDQVLDPDSAGNHIYTLSSSTDMALPAGAIVAVFVDNDNLFNISSCDKFFSGHFVQNINFLPPSVGPLTPANAITRTSSIDKQTAILQAAKEAKNK